MHPIVIEPVRTRADVNAFLALPDRVHADDPSYIAPLRPWVRRSLRPTNPALKDAQLQLFLARRGHVVVGRISALVDPVHNRHHNELVCWFGFFDFEPDDAVGRALLHKAKEQAHAWGCTTLRGQRNISRMADPGITVEGFDRAPPMLAPHQPPRVAALLEAEGFVKHHDLLAYEFELFDSAGAPTPLPEGLRVKSAELRLPGLEVRPLQRRHLYADLRRIYDVFDRSYRDVPGTAPLTWEQFLGLGIVMLGFLNPKLVQIATVHGAPVAFVICMPEFAEILPAMGNRLTPRSALRGMRSARHVRTAAIKLIGVVPEHRGSGIHARLIERAVKGIREAGYGRVDGSLIDERNGAMRAVVEGAGMHIYRRYRFFEQPVPAIDG